MSEFKMPSLGAEMESGKLLEWRVKPGDPVKRGQIVAVVDTDKAAVEVEIWEGGVVGDLLVQPGQKVPVGTPLAIIKTDASEISAPATAPAPPIATLPAEDRNKAMRATIAAAMTRSKREIPHYYLSTEIDMNRSLEWLTAENVKRPIEERILYSALLLKAVARSLKSVPELNGFWKDGVGVPSEAIHLGVAISIRGGGLIAPALHDVDKKNLGEVMKELGDLVMRTRAGSLKSSELSDATLTITNLGEQGVEEVFGVIHPPQVALVGFGKIIQKAWVTESGIAARPVIRATLSADHRVSDGHRGAIFLAALEKYLQEPKEWN